MKKTERKEKRPGKNGKKLLLYRGDLRKREISVL